MLVHNLVQVLVHLRNLLQRLTHPLNLAAPHFQVVTPRHSLKFIFFFQVQSLVVPSLLIVKLHFKFSLFVRITLLKKTPFFPLRISFLHTLQFVSVAEQDFFLSVHKRVPQNVKFAYFFLQNMLELQLFVRVRYAETIGIVELTSASRV